MKSTKRIYRYKHKNTLSEEQTLIKAAKEASSKAVRSSMAMGLNVQFIESGNIVEVSPLGKRVIRKQKTTARKIDLSQLKKGMVLERK